MRVIMSIKPEFAAKIFDGTKKYEFRRSIFKNQSINSVVVYASAPESKIIGEFEIDKILFQDISSLWAKTSKYSGITKEYYTNYFHGKLNGYAIKIKNPKRYKKKLCIHNEFGLKPPQSFAYVNEDYSQELENFRVCRPGKKKAPTINNL